MKALKESILNHSNHTGEGFKTQRRELIECWLKEYKIKKYTINDDFTIDVDGDVYLDLKDLAEFSEYIQFGVVKGDFDCGLNQLTSLKGAPKEVGGVFICSYNKITSLKGSPKKIGGSFHGSCNQLTSLKGAPKEVGGDFNCSNNKVQFTEDDVRKVCNVKDRIRVK